MYRNEVTIGQSVTNCSFVNHAALVVYFRTKIFENELALQRSTTKPTLESNRLSFVESPTVYP